MKREQELITKKYEGQGAKIEIKTELPVRHVSVNNEVVFTQEYKKQLAGTFFGFCTDLSL